ncbi:hypothetical protein NIASO_05740 [Niabella soli DSM 19437]|uniref:Uncharacterized protein n=1 Tax=Niabella soli DSM 19437 TaxID=929713 RepID=W0F7J8_9BACT|nr:hypothetical protein NIASO_05740 [Niabella soli DSM 19437]
MLQNTLFLLNGWLPRKMVFYGAHLPLILGYFVIL